MSDNVTAKKKVELREKARLIEEARKEKMRAQKLRCVDTSESEYSNCMTEEWILTRPSFFLANPSGAEEDKNIMDNLLDKLRAGELDTSLKRSKQERSGVSREKRMQKSESVAILAEDLLKSIQTEEGSPSLPRNSNRIRRNNGKDAILEEFVAS